MGPRRAVDHSAPWRRYPARARPAPQEGRRCGWPEPRPANDACSAGQEHRLGVLVHRGPTRREAKVASTRAELGTYEANQSIVSSATSALCHRSIYLILVEIIN